MYLRDNPTVASGGWTKYYVTYKDKANMCYIFPVIENAMSFYHNSVFRAYFIKSSLGDLIYVYFKMAQDMFIKIHSLRDLPKF